MIFYLPLRRLFEVSVYSNNYGGNQPLISATRKIPFSIQQEIVTGKRDTVK